MAYTKVEILNCQDHYYVVTMLQKVPLHQGCKVSGNTGTTTSLSTLNNENLDEDSVDISGVASKINQEYAINITEEKLAGILSSHRLLSGAKLAGSLASPIQIDPTPEENTVAGRLLLLHENSKLISGITDAITASNVPPTEDFPMIGMEAEELPPSIGEVVEELPPTIGVVAQKLPHPRVGTEVVPTPHINHTTSTMQQMDQMMERYPDQVCLHRW